MTLRTLSALGATLLALPAWAGLPTWSDLDASDAWEVVATKKSDVGEVIIRHRRFDDLDCLEGRVTTQGSPDAMLDVATDVEGALRWSSAPLADALDLGRTPGTIDYYQYLDVPDWTLVADRYWILRGTVLAEGDARRFRWGKGPPGMGDQARTRALARNDGAIEPPKNVGEWVFSPVSGGVDVRYRACADIGGAIPLWLQKAVAKSTLPDTVVDLVVESRKRTPAPRPAPTPEPPAPATPAETTP